MQTLYKQIEVVNKFDNLVGITMKHKEKFAIGYKLIYQAGYLQSARTDWKHIMDYDQTKWTKYKKHFASEYQDYKDDVKQVGTTSFKYNQILYDIIAQVLNQIKQKDFKDETTINMLRE